ncbi:MAG: heparan-alpha-glucosaminide N-acetyltransferase domain-containing protein [Pseudomonadota bacterium]
MSTRNREQFIDATRGLAMLGVMTAHFGWIFSSLHPEFTLGIQLSTYFEPSAPTFMLISGALLGYIYEKRQRQLGAFATKLIDRGMFLLTAGHLVIMLAYLSYAGGLAGAVTFAQIIDAIGVAIIVGPILISRLGAGARLALGVGMFAMTWLAIALWHPDSAGLQWLKDTLFGAELDRRSQWGYNFPLVPWISVYIVATALGQKLAIARIERGDAAVIRLLLGYAAIGFATVVALKLGWRLLQGQFSGDVVPGTHSYVLYSLTDVHRKWPPSPAYFVYNTSISMLLLAGLFHIEQKGWLRKSMALLTLIGQNSLFVFLVQEHVYVSWLWLANPPMQYWALAYLVTIGVNLAALFLWVRIGATRYFTVGFGSAWGPRQQGAV